MRLIRQLRPSSVVFLALALSLGLGLPGTANAQVGDLDIRFGVKTGIAASSLSGNYVEVTGLADVETRARLGFEVGGYMILGVGQPFLLQSELTYVQKGHRIDITSFGGSATIRLNSSYIEIPVLARFEIPVDDSGLDVPLLPYVVAGPALGISLNASSEAEGQGGSIQDLGFENDLSSTDIGLAVGAGIDYGLRVGTVALELRYVLGLSNVVASTPTTARNQSLRLTVGLLL